MEIIRNILAVGAGSFIGGSARYLVSLAMKGIGKGFPWATLAVNLLGCLAIGLLWGILTVPDRRSLRRIHDFLDIFQGGIGHASDRTDMRVCSICHPERPCGNCIGRTRLLYFLPRCALYNYFLIQFFPINGVQSVAICIFPHNPAIITASYAEVSSCAWTTE